ncbi:RNA polymerase sigma factor [Arenibacter echinorum]|uniref:RNA polymerase sigma factor (Sigma-70 family) n=1 Tax=Arenibacter echinorum TaxID=440515 RepID=A0A327R3B3_9FLAO|nr:sigma-70 family RNA polymerase sigma factor [Arenibacter echinorum]RAJ10233.1 RNA polymerase sigma factor (sigma-70 family) [Arenibacter echinorum]
MDLNQTSQQYQTQRVMCKPTAIVTDKSILSTDLELWKNFQGGCDLAYETIYRNYSVLLYGFGLKLTNDHELVKDCIHDLFIGIRKSRQKLGSVKSIKAYLFTSIRRMLIAELVKKRKHYTTNAVPFTLKHLQISSVEEKWIKNENIVEQQRNLKTALNKLSDCQKEIVYLKFYSLLSYQEISEVLGLSTKGAYKLMERTMFQLRKNMNFHIIA